MYFYSDTAPREALNINIGAINSSQAYLRHFDNYLFLNFVAKKGPFQERAAVEKEIIICERKLKFWQRQPNFDEKLVRKETERLIKNWRSK